MSFIKLFSGSQVKVLAVQHLLDQNKINYIVEDEISSALASGIGIADKAVNLLVHNDDLNRAKVLLRENDIDYIDWA